MAALTYFWDPAASELELKLEDILKLLASRVPDIGEHCHCHPLPFVFLVPYGAAGGTGVPAGVGLCPALDDAHGSETSKVPACSQ